MKRVVTLSLLFALFFLSSTNPKSPPNKSKNPNNSFFWKKHNYKLSEGQARNKISSEIKKRFGQIYSFLIFLWPFKSKKNIDEIKLKNKELNEIKEISEREIKSPINYKTVLCREPYIKYVVKIFHKEVPITDFKDVKRKKYNEQKLKQNTYNKIIELIQKKSYRYAFKKTKSPVMADTVQSKIANELTKKIKHGNCSLEAFIGKEREKKIDKIIETETKKINFATHSGKKCRCKRLFKKTKRVFLYPCGHIICKECFSQNNKKCPICGSKIEQGIIES